MTPGPMKFRGAHKLERGPIQMTLRREGPIEIACEDLFFFGDHLISAGKTVKISVKTFFFLFGDHLISAGKTVKILVKTFFSGDHIIFRTKQQHFLRLFWTSQNRNSVMFELAPGPWLSAPMGTSGMSLGT